MKNSFLFGITFLFNFLISAEAQEISGQTITSMWGNYVKTNLPGNSSFLVEAKIDDGHNRVWSGIFSVSGFNSYTPYLSWNNIKLLSYSVYNTSKDDVRLLLMSDNSPTTFGGHQLVLKFAPLSTYAATVKVTVIGGTAPATLALTDNSTTSPFAYTIASSAGTFNTWTVNDNVGIGTMTPQTRLDLGSIRLGGISQLPAEGSISKAVWPNFIIGSETSQRLRLGVVNDGYTRSEIDLDNSNRPDGTVAIKTSEGSAAPLTRLFIHGNGNVGIGTGATAITEYKLAVNGVIGAKKVKVTQNGWPDYVFQRDYKLRSLQELEAFIKRNSHLPSVPSSSEVEQNGLDLGNNQAVLLEKIEELTLYIIEQDKKLKAQAAKIEELSSMREEWDLLKRKLRADN